jgi:hypothetical protein
VNDQTPAPPLKLVQGGIGHDTHARRPHAGVQPARAGEAHDNSAATSLATKGFDLRGNVPGAGGGQAPPRGIMQRAAGGNGGGVGGGVGGSPRIVRLFDGVPAYPYDLNDLRILAIAHADPRLQVTSASELPAGYTYFGQLVDHDILDLAVHLPRTFGPISLQGIALMRDPALDLDSLYGPNNQANGAIDPATGAFMGTERDGLLCDHVRDSASFEARIVDRRNDENFIVSQLTLLFMNLHNRILWLRGGGPAQFAATKDDVMRLYHAVIWNDYAKRILDEEVYAFLSRKPNRVRLLPETMDACLPVEFAAAGFRFGHCLIRAGYRVRTTGERHPLGALLQHRSPNGRHVFAHPIEWHTLFDVPDAQGRRFWERASPFSTYILPAMRSLPGASHVVHLAEIDLCRGVQFGLPSAQGVLDWLARDHPGYLKAINFRIPGIRTVRRHPLSKVLHHLGLRDRIPLWTYILMEPSWRRTNRHTRLGKLGSVIVGETLRALLDASAGRARGPDTDRPVAPLALETVGMSELIRFVHGSN